MLKIHQYQDVGRIQEILQWAHREHIRAVTTTGNRGYTSAVHNIYSIPPPPQEENHEVIESLYKISQGMQTKSYKLEGLAKANTIIISSNSSVMAQLAKLAVSMNGTQVQMKTLEETSTNPTRKKGSSIFGSAEENKLMRVNLIWKYN